MAIKIQRACFVMVIFVDLVSRHGKFRHISWVARLFRPHALKNEECYICSVLVSLQGFGHDLYVICSELVSLMASRRTNATCVARSFRLMALRTTYNYFMCSALVSPRGFKNDKSYMRMALRTTYISCVARLFRLVVFRTTYSSCAARLFGLMTERYFAFIPTSIAHSRKRDGSLLTVDLVGYFVPASPL